MFLEDMPTEKPAGIGKEGLMYLTPVSSSSRDYKLTLKDNGKGEEVPRVAVKGKFIMDLISLTCRKKL